MISKTNKLGLMAIWLVLGMVLCCTGAQAYSFAPGSGSDLRIYFDDPQDLSIAQDEALADQVAAEGMAFAARNGIDLGDRTLEDVADEIQFHARVFFWLPDLPFPSKGRIRWTEEAANPADIGDGDEYWNDYGPDIWTLVRDHTRAMADDP